MLDSRQLLQKGGWRMTYREPKNRLCSELLPEPGTTIVIGRKGKGYTAAWMTSAGTLQTVNILPKKSEWEARVKRDGRSYVITVGMNAAPAAKGPLKISGLVKETSRAAVIRPPGGKEEAQGTWTAEANPGG